MTSTTYKLENGVVVFVCGGRRRHPERCTYCTRQRIATCDFKMHGLDPQVGPAEAPFHGTAQVVVESCGAALCGQCRRQIGAKDHCRVHQMRGEKEA